MTTIATLCSGFGGVDVGAQAAGLELAWGVEYDAAIAEVANANLGQHVRVANLLDCDPFDFEAVDILHASPPCPNFSVANAGKGETALDIALACKIAAFVTTLRPRIFTLENVWAYRHSKSWQILERVLHSAGYWVSVDHANAADYGVPQTRKRMIVRAVLGGFVPYLPEPLPWVGWYAAIEDMLDTLPESQFAPWQMARLPEMLRSAIVPQGGFEERTLPVREGLEPMFTITANHNQLGLKAFLMQVQGEGGDGLLYADEPMQTVTANHGAAKYRAWLLPGQDFTQARASNEPSYTISATELKHNSRAWLEGGRVVAMTPRALARFQSFPDWYELPDNARLAAKGIGNAVPPLLYQGVIAPLLGGL